MYTENGRYEPYRRRSYHDEREESSDSDIELKLIREFREKRKVFINYFAKKFFLRIYFFLFFFRKNKTNIKIMR